jgi:hypothetical protein
MLVPVPCEIDRNSLLLNKEAAIMQQGLFKMSQNVIQSMNWNVYNRPNCLLEFW